MERNSPLNKRKRSSSSDPLSGIFTRSKSQVSLHQSRSGRIRRDALEKSRFRFVHAPLYLLRRRGRSPRIGAAKGTISDRNEVFPLSVVDLRARRVYSSSSMIDDCCFVKDIKLDSFHDSSAIDTSVDFVKSQVSSPDRKDLKSGNDYMVCDDKVPNPFTENPSIVEASHHQLNLKDSRSIDKIISLNSNDEITDGFISNTDDVEEPKESGKRSCTTEMAGQENRPSKKAPVLKEKSETDMEDESKNRPFSLSDDTDLSTPDGVFTQAPVNPPISGCASQSSNRSHRLEDGLINKSGRGVVIPCKRGLVLNPCSKVRVFKAPSSFSYRRLLPYLMDIVKDNPTAQKTGSEVKPLPSNEKESPPDQSVLPSDPLSLPASPNATPEINQVTVCEANPTAKSSETSPSETTSITTQPDISASTPAIDVTAVDAPLAQPLIPTSSPSTGILKKNPRGCRGLCPCLNCASFRLHAERAFEFSRNQMQDSEELSSNLITELSRLRRLIEPRNGETAASMHEVSEACRRATMAEEVAIARIAEMKEDLNIHCKTRCLQRPTVKFAAAADNPV